ncbi:uncharacterized protein [Nicotiana sylvestris]|uniref:uncharacterized protein n=1 Tax=Nicotiana sylvestris TaxID=4096 RepID=UPI00388C6028
MAFASNLNKKSSEVMRRLKESLREFPATTWNDVYNRYSTKLRIEEDTIIQSRKDERESSRRAETKKRSGKNSYTGEASTTGLEEDSITFNDADGVLTLHNDALVISLLVHDTNVKQVLIDPGSSVNINLLRVVNELQVDDKLTPKTHTLSGFDNSSVTKGEIILTTFAEGVVKDTEFQVVKMDMTYNMILGRPWIHEMDVVPSTLYQVFKFPSQWGIWKIRGDQQVSRSINFVEDSIAKTDEK